MTASKGFLEFLLAAFFLVSAPGSLFAGGTTYLKSSEVPRASKTPKGVSLKTANGSDSAFNVRAALAEIRLDQAASRGGAGMTGRLNTFRKFIRIDIRGVTPLSQPANLEVEYSVEEGDGLETKKDSVSITGQASAIVVDTDGFEDKTGTEVRSSSTVTTISSTKYKHFNAEIVAVKIRITDKAGKSLYAGAWPEAPQEKVILPERLKPRIFTAQDGRKVTATIASVGAESVKLVINGKDYEINLSNLSEQDQTYLKGIRQSVSQ